MTVTGSKFDQILHVIGCANGHGGRHLGCEEAAETIKNSEFFKNISLNTKWTTTIQEIPSGMHLAALPCISKVCEQLAMETSRFVRDDEPVVIVGGDHSCAVGTWSGAATALRDKGDFGLIWVDAHLDVHTPETSDTGNLHGMPVAHLLGYGTPELREIKDKLPKILPKNLAYLGSRSFEPPETKLLEELGVRVFYIEEVNKRGIHECLREAIEIVSRDTVGFGFSIDIDGFRIQDAPAVGTPADDGIIAAEFIQSLKQQNLSKFVTAEIVEFLPRFDDVNKTSERLVVDLIQALYERKFELLGKRDGSHQG